MKTYSPVISIILGFIFINLISFSLPAYTSLLDSLILIVPMTILGGFIATVLSNDNKAIYGSYLGIVFSPFYMFSAIIHNDTTYYLVVIEFLIVGYIGGYIGMILRLRLDNENQLEENY